MKRRLQRGAIRACSNMTTCKPVICLYISTKEAKQHLTLINSNNQDDPIVAQPQPPSKIEYQPNTSFVTPIEKLGDEPEFIDCPFCNRRTQTRVERSHSPMT